MWFQLCTEHPAVSLSHRGASVCKHRTVLNPWVPSKNRWESDMEHRKYTYLSVSRRRLIQGRVCVLQAGLALHQGTNVAANGIRGFALP